MKLPLTSMFFGALASATRHCFFAVLALAGSLSLQAQAPLSAKIDFQGNSEFPAGAISLTVTRAGQTRFTGSNNKTERGSPLFSSQVDAGATFYACDTVLGFPQPTGNRPSINRLGASSFIAVKETTNGGRKFWINASVGAYRISGGFVSDWEYQIRYYSGDTNKNEPPTLTAGIIPNSGFYGGVAAAGKAELQFADLPDLQAIIDPDLIQFDSGFRPGASGAISVLVTNAGPGMAVGPIEVSIYLSKDNKLDIPGDSPIKSVTVTDIAPGASTLVTTTPFQIPPTFTTPDFYFAAAVDAGKSIPETNDENNSVLVPAPVPDLRPILDFDFSDPRPGRKGTVKLTVRNDGKGSFQGAVDASLSVFATLAGPSEEFVIPVKSPLQITKLKPGNQQTFDLPNIEIPKRILEKLTPKPVNIVWIAKLDENNAIQELNEENNVTRLPNGFPGLLNIKGYDIHGKVLTRWLKKPIEQVEIRVHRDSGNSAAPLGEIVATAFTDSNGEYRIEGLPYGDYLVEPIKPDWRISGFDGKLGDILKLIDSVPGSQLILKGDIEVLTFYGVGDIVLKSASTSFGAMPYFLEGVPLDVKFDATIEWGGHEPGKIIFTSDKGSSEFSSDSDTFSINLDAGTEFEACAVYAVHAQSTDKTESKKKDLFIVLGKHPSLELEPGRSNPLYYKISKKFGQPPDSSSEDTDAIKWEILKSKLSIPKSIPFLGGNSFKFEWAPGLSAELRNSSLTRKLQIMEFKPEFGESYKLKIVPKFGWKEKYSLDSCAWTTTERFLELAGEAEFKAPKIPLVTVLLYPVVYAQVSFLPKVGLKVNLEDAYPFIAGGDLSLEGAIRIAIEANVLLASATGYGEGGLSGKYKLAEQKWSEAYLFGQLGVKWNRLGYQSEEISRRWEVDLLNPPALFALNEAELPFLSYHIAPRDYLNDPSFGSWWGDSLTRQNNSIHDLAGGVLLSTSVYPETQPSVSSSADQMILAWLQDDPARTAVNRSKLVVSHFDGQQWSKPFAIADDQTADFHPQVKVPSDGHAIVAWMDAQKPQPDDAPFDDVVRSMEISVAQYDPATTTWSKATRLTANAYLDHSPRVAAYSRDMATVVWLSNPANNLFGTASQPNEIWASRLNNGAWSSPQLVAQVPFAVTGFDALQSTNDCTIVLSLDTDGDLATDVDRELFALQGHDGTWGTLTRLTQDELPDENPHLVAGTTAPSIIWIKDESISISAGLDLQKPSVVYNAQNSPNAKNFGIATGPEGKLALVWSGTSEYTADLQALLYEPAAGRWSAPIALTHDPEVERAPTAAFWSADYLNVVYNRFLPKGTNLTNPTDLYFLQKHLIYDVGVQSSATPLVPANPLPGTNVLLTVAVTNNGAWPVQDLPVVFYVGDPAKGGTEIGRTNLPSALVPGASIDVSMPWIVPITTNSQMIVALVDTSKMPSDAIATNNQTVLQVGRADLNLANLYWDRSDNGQVKIIAQISNLGTIPSPVARLDLAITGGITVDLPLSVPVVPVNEMVEVSVVVTNTSLEALSLKAEIQTAGLDFDLANNGLEISLPSAKGALSQIVVGVRNTGGKLEVTFNSKVDSTYLIEISDDLASWQTAATIKATATQTSFSEDWSPARSKRFYRIRSQP